MMLLILYNVADKAMKMPRYICTFVVQICHKTYFLIQGIQRRMVLVVNLFRIFYFLFFLICCCYI